MAVTNEQNNISLFIKIYKINQVNNDVEQGTDSSRLRTETGRDGLFKNYITLISKATMRAGRELTPSLH